MLTRTFKGFIVLWLAAGAFGGPSAAVATVSHVSRTVSTQAAPRRRPRVEAEEGCRELPAAPVVPPPPASCS
jgi:hypothetical protein